MLLHFVIEHSFSLYDDAYIYFRYAQNLRAGCGPTFNCGDPAVEGFTSPLFLALLVLGDALSGDLEAWSQVLGAACLGAALALAVRMPTLAAWREALPSGAVVIAAGAVALVLHFDDYVLLNAVSGLETGLGAAMVVALARAVYRRDLAWTATWAVMGVLVRPEHGIFVLLLPLLPWARRRRAVIAVVAALASISAVRWLVFDDLLPNTYWAKAGGTAEHARLGLHYVGQVLVDFPLLLAAPLALLDRTRRREHAFLLAGAGLWLAFFLRSGGDHFMYGRLALPLVPTLSAMAALGLGVVPLPRDGGRGLRAAVILVPVLAVGLRARRQHDLEPTHGFDNVQRWTEVGRWLAEHHPSATIATVPVGAMAYHSGLRTLDLVGITSREVAKAGRGVPPELMRRHWLGHERHATEWILQQAPDLVVTTKYRAEPWRGLAEAKAGFYADWLLLQEIKAGRAPYVVHDAEIAPGVHWLMYRRIPGAPP